MLKPSFYLKRIPVMLKTKLILFLLFLLTFASGNAQESMMPDVSKTYLDKLVAAAKATYPKMKTYDYRADVAKANIQRSKLSWFDVLSFSFLYSPNNSTTLVNPSVLNGYQVGMYVNFGLLMQKGPAMKQARAELEIVKAEKDEYNLNIEALVKQRYYLYIQQLSLLKLRTTAAIDAESTMKEMKYKFEKGEETFQTYNNVLLAYNDHIQSKIETESLLLISKSNLEELLGQKLEDIK